MTSWARDLATHHLNRRERARKPSTSVTRGRRLAAPWIQSFLSFPLFAQIFTSTTWTSCEHDQKRWPEKMVFRARHRLTSHIRSKRKIINEAQDVSNEPECISIQLWRARAHEFASLCLRTALTHWRTICLDIRFRFFLSSVFFYNKFDERRG